NNAEKFSFIAGEFSFTAKEFSFIAGEFSFTAKEFSFIAGEFSFTAKEFSFIAEEFSFQRSPLKIAILPSGFPEQHRWSNDHFFSCSFTHIVNRKCSS